MTRQQHAAPVLAQLATTGDPDKLFDGRVPDGTEPPYRVVYFEFRRPGAADRPDASNLVFDSLPFEVTATVHSVGGGDDPDFAARSARAIADQSEAALLDFRPTVAGRFCTPMRWVDGYAPKPDEQTGQAYHDQTDVYRFTSHPA